MPISTSQYSYLPPPAGYNGPTFVYTGTPPKGNMEFKPFLSIGSFGFLAMGITMSVLSSSVGKHSEALFYTGLAFTAVGVLGLIGTLAENAKKIKQCVSGYFPPKPTMERLSQKEHSVRVTVHKILIPQSQMRQYDTFTAPPPINPISFPVTDNKDPPPALISHTTPNQASSSSMPVTDLQALAKLASQFMSQGYNMETAMRMVIDGIAPPMSPTNPVTA